MQQKSKGRIFDVKGSKKCHSAALVRPPLLSLFVLVFSFVAFLISPTVKFLSNPSFSSFLISE